MYAILNIIQVVLTVTIILQTCVTHLWELTSYSKADFKVATELLITSKKNRIPRLMKEDKIDPSLC